MAFQFGLAWRRRSRAVCDEHQRLQGCTLIPLALFAGLALAILAWTTWQSVAGFRQSQSALVAEATARSAAHFALAMSLNCHDGCSPLSDSITPAARLLLVPAGTEVAQATARAPVPGRPDWQVVGWTDPAVVAAWRDQRLLAALGLGLAVLVAAVALTVWVRRNTRAAIAAHQRLAANRQKLAAVLDGTTEGIILTGRDGTIELFNPAAEMMFGHLAEDLHECPPTALLPDLAVLPDARADYETPAMRGLPRLREVRGVRAGGEEFQARVSLRHLALVDGPRLLLVVQDLTETVQNAERLTYLEQHDVLTDLLNRKEFERRMQRVLTEAAGSENTHVLCYIDIDQFKVVNDTLGHAAGDALVRQLATLIAARLDEAVLIGRLGGDEFGVLFADCDQSRAIDLCEGLMQTVRNFLFTWRDHSFDVAVSMGLTAFLPENDSAAAELAKADVACHMAKHLGRDRIHVYHEGDTSVIRHHGDMHLVSAISQALNGGRFRLYVQPIMPLATGSGGRMHYEVLVRMLDEQGELMVPGRFIPAAEQYILMPAVDRWIIHQLFSTQGDALRDWHLAHGAHFLFALNLSGTSVADESFLPYLRRQFEVHRVPPAAICFEITETAAIRDMETALAFMRELVDMGCSLALDDFGSGLASYGYLRELPVKFLKIDGSFVRDMHRNAVNHALVASINEVAHVLGIQTIAEWAEDDEIIECLRGLRVDFVQGYAIGTPVPVSAFRPGNVMPPPVGGRVAVVHG